MARKNRPVGPWACAVCRSINNEKAKQCYQCRTPRHLAYVDPATMEVTGHGQVREVALPRYRATQGRAIVASALIIASALAHAFRTSISTKAIQELFDTGVTSEQMVTQVTNVGLVSLGISLFALVAWALWLSRVVGAMPALGLGYPAATPMTAIWETIIPILNFLRVPAIVRDISNRVAPGNPRGNALIGGALFGLFGAFILERAGGFVLGIMYAAGGMTLDEYVQAVFLLTGATAALFIAGAFLLVILTWWVERKIAIRRSAMRTDAAAAAPTVGAAAAGPSTVVAAPAGSVATAPIATAAVVAAPALPRPATPDPVGGSPAPSPPSGFGAGPRLHVTIGPAGIVASVDGSDDEPTTVDELREASPALAAAGGTAVVTAMSGDDSVRETVAVVVDTFRAAGVPTRTA